MAEVQGRALEWPPVSPTRTHGGWGLLAASLTGLACTAGPPVLCVTGLPDGGCSYHVEVHCGDTALCSQGSVPVLDAGTCVRDTGADVIGCT